jgi:hypothetical protein
MTDQYIVTMSNGETSHGLADMNEVAEWLIYNANESFWVGSGKKKLITLVRKPKARVSCAHCDCNEYRPTTDWGSACECNHALSDHGKASRAHLIKQRLTVSERFNRKQEKQRRKQQRREEIWGK